MPPEDFFNYLLLTEIAKDGYHYHRTGFFHYDWRKEYIMRASGKKTFHQCIIQLRIHVINIGFDLQNSISFCRQLGLANKNS